MKTAPPTAAARIPRRAWVMLAASVMVAVASSAVTAGAPFLIPALQDERGLSLTSAGLIVASATAGTALTLVAWGWLVDHTGERLVLTLGAGGATLALVGAAYAGAPGWLAVCLLLAGAASASANSASGRVVVGWFPAHRRGMAMGIRQMSQPLGAALTAATMPAIARSHGVSAALVIPLALCATATVVAWTVIADPPRPARGGADPAAQVNPYRGSRYLVRIHGSSVLLVVPQALMQTFLLVWLISGRGWHPGAAGMVVMSAQIAAALGRIAVGAFSDRAGSRMGPLRAVAVAGVVGSAALAAAELFGAPGEVAVTLAIIVTVISVADNGLAFTAVAEYAGPLWSGRALGTQNTSQFLAVAASAPLLGALIEHAGYPSAYLVSAVLAALAVPLIPRRDQHRTPPT